VQHDVKDAVVEHELGDDVRSAQRRRESRGLHFSRDYPQMLEKARDTVLRP
jgi:aspartate oxidase